MKGQPGKITQAFQLVVMSVFALATVGLCLAQSNTFQDVCATYQHQSVKFANATPTAKLVTGGTNSTIYVCAIHVAQAAGATPGLTLTNGTTVSGTPCATGGGTLGVYGGGTAGYTNNIGNGMTTVLQVPSGTDLCALTATAAFPAGSIEYVQR